MARPPDILNRTAIPLEATSDMPLGPVIAPPIEASNDPDDQGKGVAKEITAEELAAATVARKGAAPDAKPEDDKPEPETKKEETAPPEKPEDDSLPGDPDIESDDIRKDMPSIARREVAKERQKAREYRAALDAAVKAKIGDEAWDNVFKLARDRALQAEKERADKAISDARKAQTAAQEAADAAKSEMEALRAATPEPQAPPPDPRPTRDAFDDPEAYDEALVSWGRRETLRETNAAAAEAKKVADLAKQVAETEAKIKADQEAQAVRDAEITRVHNEWQTRRTAAIDKYPDYAEVAEADPASGGPVISDAMAAGIMQADNGTDIAYHLGMNPDESSRIAQIPNPFRQMLEIGRIAERLANPPPPRRARPAPIVPIDTAENRADTTEREPTMEELDAAYRKSNSRRPFFPPSELH